MPEEAVERIREWIDSGASLDDIAPELSLENIVPPPRYPAPPETYPVAVPVTALAFSPDGRELAVGGYHEVLVSVDERGRLHRWGVDDAKVTHRVDLPAKPLRMSGTAGTPTVALADGSVLIIDTADLATR